MSGLGLTFLRRGNLAHPTVGTDYILSETKGDPEVFRILMSKGISSDGVGITKDDAAAVKSIGTWFSGNTIVETFDELGRFVNVTKLDRAAFQNCTSLKSIDISRMTELGTSAFNGCTSLSDDLNLPNLTGTIGGSTFKSTAIKRIVSLGSITSIGDYAFGLNTALEFVDLPITITSIGDYAFYGCPSLLSIICRATTPPTLGGASVFDSTNNCPIYVPDGSIEAYKTATNWTEYASRIYPMSMWEIEQDGLLADCLIGAYTFEGKSNDDPDATVVADKSKYGNDMQLVNWVFGGGDEYTQNGYYDGYLCHNKQLGYAYIPLSVPITDCTIIVERYPYNAAGMASWQCILGSETPDGTNSPVVVEGTEDPARDSTIHNSYFGKSAYGRDASSHIVWMNADRTNYGYLTGEKNDIQVQAFLLGIYRRSSNVFASRYNIKSLYIFNKSLHPATIEKFIRDNIDETYVRPEVTE